MVDETEIAKAARQTIAIWIALAGGNEKLGAAWLQGVALDWSLDCGCEPRAIVDRLYTRVRDREI